MNMLNTFSIREPNDDEYIGADGIILCSNCHTPRIMQVDTIKGKPIFLNCNCQCYLSKIEAEKIRRKHAEFIAKVNGLKAQSDLDSRFSDVSFDTDKTHKLACMINAIAEKGYLPYFTTFNNIVRDIKSTYRRGSLKSEEDIIDFLVDDVQFLFIDDLGTEYLSEDGSGFIKEIIFDIVNKRYNALKPIIYSSNFKYEELQQKANIDERILHRIGETCKGGAVAFYGKNMRAEK